LCDNELNIDYFFGTGVKEMIQAMDSQVEDVYRVGLYVYTSYKVHENVLQSDGVAVTDKTMQFLQKGSQISQNKHSYVLCNVLNSPIFLYLQTALPAP